MEAAIIKVDKGRFELKLSLRKSDTMPDPDKVREEGRTWLKIALHPWRSLYILIQYPLPKTKPS